MSPGRLYSRKILLAAVLAAWTSRGPVAQEQYPPIFLAADPPGTAMHCHLAPSYNDYSPSMMDTADNTHATVHYAAWDCARTLEGYRLRALVGGAPLFDEDSAAFWNLGANRFDPPIPVGDISHPIEATFFWNGVSCGAQYVPPDPGLGVMRVSWDDNDFLIDGGEPHLGTKDQPGVYDDVSLVVVNNFFPGRSYVLADGAYLGRMWMDDNFPPPPNYGTEFSWGKLHMALGETLWSNEVRNVISFEVDRYTGYTTVEPLRAGWDHRWVLFAPGNLPNDHPGHVFYPTLLPTYVERSIDHTAVSTTVLTPVDNPVLNYSICVVRGTLGLPLQVPNNPGGVPVTVTYAVEPADHVDLEPGNAVVAELYNPDYPGHVYTKLLGQSRSGSFTWDGRFDGGALSPTNSIYGRLKVEAQDFWYDGVIQASTPRRMTFEQAAIWVLHPSHRFRTEGWPYGYEDQVVGTSEYNQYGTTLDFKLGWNPANTHPTPDILWQNSNGEMGTEPETQFGPNALLPGERVIENIWVTLDGHYRSKEVEVFGDQLGRDIQNFNGGTSTNPLPWWSHASTGHGATRHARDGSGNLDDTAFYCPWCNWSGCLNMVIYDPQSSIDYIDSWPKQRGNIVEYSADGGPGFHSATLTGTGTQTWEVGGGVPASNQFRLDQIHRELAPIIRLHAPLW